jgi:hypothetical protein
MQFFLTASLTNRNKLSVVWLFMHEDQPVLTLLFYLIFSFFFLVLGILSPTHTRFLSVCPFSLLFYPFGPRIKRDVFTVVVVAVVVATAPFPHYTITTSALQEKRKSLAQDYMPVDGRL